MTLEEFSGQMERLVNTYGKASYSDERLKLIRQAVGDFSVEWFRETVDDLIGTQRQAPLVDAFEEAASKEREKQWRRQKEINAQDARDWATGRLMPDDKKMIMQTIRDRIQGRVDDERWTSFLLLLDSVAGADPDAPMRPARRPAPELSERQLRALPYVDN